MGKIVHYPEEIKWEAVQLRQKGLTYKIIQEKLNIKNKRQIQNWMKWYENGETYRFSQGVRKQYSYGKGMEELSEVEQLKKRNKQLSIQVEILKKYQEIGKELVPKVILELVKILKEKYPIQLICECMGVARSSYYRWLKKGIKLITKLENKIKEICIKHKYLIGHRTVKAWLLREYNIKVNRKTVQRIMQKHNWQCRVKPKRKGKILGESRIVVSNNLDQNFKASKPNEKWVTDITYLPFGQSMMYLSSIMDLYNNEIIAYRIGLSLDVTLVLDTLKDALDNQSEVKGVILHSDQGSQYTSYAFQNLAKENGIITSMSRKGNCFDNAVIESFHSTIKSEEFYSQPREDLTNPIVVEKVRKFIYYYNTIRLQAKLNYLSPIEFREQAA
ncbi:IS3 family transposase [Bacillus sp. F19]|nr:IS3 family transposase [Bacillus sp. F19]